MKKCPITNKYIYTDTVFFRGFRSAEVALLKVTQSQRVFFFINIPKFLRGLYSARSPNAPFLTDFKKLALCICSVAARAGDADKDTLIHKSQKLSFHLTESAHIAGSTSTYTVAWPGPSQIVVPIWSIRDWDAQPLG